MEQQDRQWEWTDGERGDGLGATRPAQRRLSVVARLGSRREVTLLALLVSLAGAFAGWHARLVARPAPPAVVYGTGLAHMSGTSQEMTCTAMAEKPDGSELCTRWTVLRPGQQAVQARLLDDMQCPAVEADQATGRWACTVPTTT